MDILSEKQQVVKSSKVQKLNLLEVINFIINSDIEDKKRLIKIIDTELGLTPISKAKDVLGKSYNGIKNFGDVINIGGKNFVSFSKEDDEFPF